MPVKWESRFAEQGEAWRNLIALQLNAANANMVLVAKELVPKDTHLSEHTISVLEEATTEKLRAVSHAPAQNEQGEYYDIYPEFGTIYQDAQPFWTPAFKLARHQLLNALRTIGGRTKIELTYDVYNLTNPDTIKFR